MPNLASLLGHGLLILGAPSSHLTVIGWFTPPEAVRREAVRAGAAYALALATVIVLFLRTPQPGEHPIDSEIHFARLDEAGPYTLVALGAYGLDLAHTARSASLPSSRAIGRPWLSGSLRLTALGAVLVIASLGCKLIGLVGRWAGTDDRTSPCSGRVPPARPGWYAMWRRGCTG
ncbi:hypothetical protein [Streptomyces sirii]|uniref:hypothetical protein n=1 Tax=Streptomyces sirii TaxID=3127701 RepID=UPI003D35EF63